MNRRWGQLVLVSVVVAIASALAPACVHDDSSVFIRDVLAPPISAAGGMCIYSNDPAQAFQSEGTIDVGLTGSYVAPLLVGNQLEPTADPTQGRTETNRVTIQGAVVRLTDASGNQLTSFTAPTSATIDPLQGTTPSYSPVFVQLVDIGTVRSLAVPQGAAKQLVANIKVFGVTLGGKSVESNEFQYPISACNGCLVTFPMGSSSPFYSLPNCLGMNTTAATTTACIVGQDQIIPCTECVMTNPQVCGGGATPIADAGAGG